jgi:hypothetical protein
MNIDATTRMLTRLQIMRGELNSAIASTEQAQHPDAGRWFPGFRPFDTEAAVASAREAVRHIRTAGRLEPEGLPGYAYDGALLRSGDAADLAERAVGRLHSAITDIEDRTGMGSGWEMYTNDALETLAEWRTKLDNSAALISDEAVITRSEQIVDRVLNEMQGDGSLGGALAGKVAEAAKAVTAAQLGSVGA